MRNTKCSTNVCVVASVHPLNNGCKKYLQWKRKYTQFYIIHLQITKRLNIIKCVTE